MGALRFTPHGAVPVPDTLQIRVAPRFEGRFGAGAPTPGRALGADEVVDNFAWFVASGPRGVPVRRVVVSGVPDDLDAGLVAELRARGATWVGVHAERSAAGRWAAADSVAVTWRGDGELGPGLAVTIPLDAACLPSLGTLLARARAAGAARIVLGWPFPDGAPPPPAGEVVEALVGVRTQLPGVTLKGLPACLLQPLRRSVPELAERISRTRNRWYVDADHQRGEALLFVPDVVRFTKLESCRFCAFDALCDGVASAWWRLGLCGPLLPVGDGAAGGG